MIDRQIPLTAGLIASGIAHAALLAAIIAGGWEWQGPQPQPLEIAVEVVVAAASSEMTETSTGSLATPAAEPTTREPPRATAVPMENLTPVPEEAREMPVPRAPIKRQSVRPERATPAQPAVQAEPAATPEVEEPAEQTPPIAEPAARNSGGAPATATAAAAVPPRPSGGASTGPRAAAGNPAPEYPPQARRRGIEGRVVVRVQVEADGSVSNANVIASSGSTLLDQSALDAVKRWRFSPAQVNGEPHGANLDLPIAFRLLD